MTASSDTDAKYNIVLFISSDIVGRGENIELGNLLMEKFLHEVGGHVNRPDIIIMMNNGVKLVKEDSLAFGELKHLEELGVDILACGTCLSRLGIAESISVGKASNMRDITGILLNAGKVISI